MRHLASSFLVLTPQIAIEKDLRFTHHAGLARILEICGPEYFQSPSLLPIFESVRMTLVR